MICRDPPRHLHDDLPRSAEVSVHNCELGPSRANATLSLRGDCDAVKCR